MNWWIKVFLVTLVSAQWRRISCQEKTMENISTTAETMEKKSLADSINEFGYRLLTTMMNRTENSNVVISPAGIAGLLAMTLLGSIGNTYEEIAANLGFSQDVLQNHGNHGYLGGLLQALNEGISSKTLYADAIFVDAHTHLRDLYRTFLLTTYNAEALETDFLDSTKAREIINEWVKLHTKGKIEGFLKQTLPESTKVVLLSALYFSGQWAHPFSPRHTKKFNFTTATDIKKANLMANFGHFDYIFSLEDELHMVALPYNDSVTTMYALKPSFPTNLSLSKLMQRLNYAKIDKLINQMKRKQCIIRFPKMEIKSSNKLEDSLKDLGVKSMFLPGVANFALMVTSNKTDNTTEVEIASRINGSNELESSYIRRLLEGLGNPGIYVDSVLHDVNLNIDEYGTEAVAVTSAVLERTTELFYADSPFYMFIRNEKTKLVTFSAIIFDPTTQQ